MRAEKDSNDLELIAANPSQKPVFENLSQLYLHDMSTYFPDLTCEDGRFENRILDEAWQHPFLFRARGQIAGFALITTKCTIRDRDPCWYVAEFFVLRPFRRHGIGRAAMNALFARLQGAWEITWIDGNLPAARFWPRVIPLTERETFQIHDDGLDWTSVAFAAPVATA